MYPHGGFSTATRQDHEVGHLAWRYRPTSTSAGAAVVLPGNQPPVPAENRVRHDDAGDLRQNPPAEFLASHRESTALGVGQAKWTWAKLLPEDPILLPEIIDHVFLVAVHPASGREYEEAQSVWHSLRLLREQPLAPTLFRRFANLGRFVAPYGVDAPVPGYPKRPVPRDEDAAKALRKRTLTNLYTTTPARSGSLMRTTPLTPLWLPRTVGRRRSPTTMFCASCWHSTAATCERACGNDECRPWCVGA